jgi:hypothetical protein
MQALGGGATGPADSFFDRILKYVPTEIVGAWVAITGMIDSSESAPGSAHWIMFAILTALTPFWVAKQAAEPGKPLALTQTLIGTAAFVVWVFALGGPFRTLAFYTPLWGSLTLIVFTLTAGLITPREG